MYFKINELLECSHPMSVKNSRHIHVFSKFSMQVEGELEKLC